MQVQNLFRFLINCHILPLGNLLRNTLPFQEALYYVISQKNQPFLHLLSARNSDQRWANSLHKARGCVCRWQLQKIPLQSLQTRTRQNESAGFWQVQGYGFFPLTAYIRHKKVPRKNPGNFSIMEFCILSSNKLYPFLFYPLTVLLRTYKSL